MNPLRLGLFITLAILIAGTLLYRLWPSDYTISARKAAETASEYHGVSPFDFMKMTASGDELIIVDIRSKEEFEAGHIEGALNIPAAEILKKRNIRKIKRGPVLLYGSSERESHMIALLLQMTGSEADAVNSNYAHLRSLQEESVSTPMLFFREEKVRYNYNRYFKAFDITPDEPAEIKVPVPAPGGC
jgi:rhodanese-related sulfurtransferase